VTGLNTSVGKFVISGQSLFKAETNQFSELTKVKRDCPEITNFPTEVFNPVTKPSLGALISVFSSSH